MYKHKIKNFTEFTACKYPSMLRCISENKYIIIAIRGGKKIPVTHSLIFTT